MSGDLAVVRKGAQSISIYLYIWPSRQATVHSRQYSRISVQPLVYSTKTIRRHFRGNILTGLLNKTCFLDSWWHISALDIDIIEIKIINVDRTKPIVNIQLYTVRYEAIQRTKITLIKKHISAKIGYIVC